MTDRDENSRETWHVERGIPLALLFAIFLQTVGLVWWASGLTFRVDALEKQVAASSWQAERIVRLDERITNVQTGISDIKTMVAQKPTFEPLR